MASSDVLNELIAHFAGYLRLPPGDNYTVKILYEGSAVPDTGQADDNAKSHAARHPDLDPMHGAHLNVPVIPAFKPVHLFYLTPHKFQNTDFHSPHPALIQPHPLPPLLNGPAGSGGGGGGGGDFHMTATYQSGGDETILDIRQINVLSSNNLLINNQQVISATEAYNQNLHNAEKVLGEMIKVANDVVPNSLNLSEDNTSSGLQQFVDARDAHPISTLAQDAPFSTHTGQYLNGTPVTDGSNPHQTADNLLTTVANAEQAGITAPPQAPAGDHQHDHIATVSVGNNYQANEAAIVNDQPLSVMLAVQGNYYQTEAIIQTNVYGGSNHISGGGPGAASVASNTIQNIADIQNEVPTLTSGGSGTTTSGLNWSVTVLNGDLVDVHSLVQTNYLQNNNVVYQTTEMGESLTVAGSNIQTNSAEYQNLTSNYQLIIVEGNYNQADMIYQTNVMLDNNNVRFHGGHGHGGDGGGSASATGGGDSLVNDATIVDTANHNYQAFTPAAQSVLQALESQSGTVDPASVLSAFPNLFGNINVLVVTGNYYDINYISQTNIMSNSNVVHMWGGHGATDTVNTGSNIAVNAATIIDGGSALSPYLQGNYYNDMILLQTNIIGNNASAAAHNPGQFVPELVAFTGALDSAHQGSEATVAAAASTQHHHHDGVAGVLH
jgi:hypothetical protein